MKHTKLGITREEFLNRIRATLGRDSSSHPPTPPRSGSDELIRLTPRGENLAEIFVQRATSMGMTVHRIPMDALGRLIQSLLSDLQAKTVALDMPSFLEDFIRDAIADRWKVIDPKLARNLDVQFDCDVGITGIVGAIAETGTLVLSSDKARSRGTFLIPPVHIAVMWESHIAADMIDFMAFAQLYVKNHISSALTFVTGPSKTADIEGILITGVHGPKAVHVIVLENPKDDSPS